MNPSEEINEGIGSPADLGIQAVEAQAQALHALALSLNGAFDDTVRAMLDNSGYLVISGTGPARMAGRKLADALSSIGRPSVFVQPEEAVCGDLTMIRPDSLVLLISNSTDAAEFKTLLPVLKKTGNKIIALTGRENSPLESDADIILTLPVQQEVSSNHPLGGTFSVLAVALAEALTAALTHRQKIQPDDTAEMKPDDAVEMKPEEPVKEEQNPLPAKVSDRMLKRSERDLPIVCPTASAREVIWSIIEGRMGMVLVMDDELLAGIITDSDLRYAMRNISFSMTETSAADIMYWNPPTISEDAAWSEAETIMSKKRLKALVALDEEARVTGVVEIY